MNLENISVLVFEILTRNYLKTNFIKIKFYIDYIADQKEKLFMLKLILPEEKYWQSFQEGLLEYKSPLPHTIYKELKRLLHMNVLQITNVIAKI